MITLGEFLKLIDNFFYNDTATIQVFDSEYVAPDSDGLREDVVGFAFSVSVGESCDFLDDRYKYAAITNIYICKKRVIKVLINRAECAEETPCGGKRCCDYADELDLPNIAPPNSGAGDTDLSTKVNTGE